MSGSEQDKDLDGNLTDLVTKMHYLTLRATLRDEFRAEVDQVRGDLGRVQNNLDGLGTDFQKLSVTVDDNHKVLLDAIAKLTASMQLGTRGDAGSVHLPYEPRDETDTKAAAR